MRHALVYLGLNTVKNIALSISTVNALPRHHLPCFRTQDFLMHSLTTAAISQHIAKHFKVGDDATDVFVAGLLHDFGKAVLAQFATEGFTQAVNEAAERNESLHISESRVLGMNHADVGSMLAEKWELPSDLVACIRDHHSDVSSPLGDCVFAANQISKHLKFGVSGNPMIEVFPERIQRRFGMDMTEMLIELGDLSAETDKAQAFIHM